MSCLTSADRLHEIVSHTVIQDNVTWGVFFKDRLLFKIKRSEYLQGKGLIQPGLYIAGDWASKLKPNVTLGPYMGTVAKPEDFDNGYVFQNSATHPRPIDGKQSPTGLQFMNSVKKDKNVVHNVTFGNFRKSWPPVKVVGPNRLKDSVELLANYDWRTGSEANEALVDLSDDGKRRLSELKVYDRPIQQFTYDPRVNMNDPKDWKICMLSVSKSIWDQLNLEKVGNGGCGIKLLERLFDKDNDYVYTFFDDFTKSITNQRGYKLKPGRCPDVLLLIAFIINHGHNAMVVDEQSYFVGEVDATTIILVKESTGWVAMAKGGSVVLPKELAKRAQGLLKLPLTKPDSLFTKQRMNQVVDEALDDLVVKRKNTFINLATPSPDTSDDEGTAQNPIVLDTLFADLAIY